MLQIINLINIKSRSNLWGWKDPQSTLTLDLFLPYITNPYFVVVSRNFESVARSNTKLLRGEINFTEAVKLTEYVNKEITSYEWEFGDGKKETTSTNSVEHIYSDTGTYTLKLTVTDGDGLTSSKNFEIKVVNPKNLINSTIQGSLQKINNLETELEEIDEWIRKLLEKEISIDERLPSSGTGKQRHQLENMSVQREDAQVEVVISSKDKEKFLP